MMANETLFWECWCEYGNLHPMTELKCERCDEYLDDPSRTIYKIDSIEYAVFEADFLKNPLSLDEMLVLDHDFSRYHTLEYALSGCWEILNDIDATRDCGFDAGGFDSRVVFVTGLTFPLLVIEENRLSDDPIARPDRKGVAITIWDAIVTRHGDRWS